MLIGVPKEIKAQEFRVGMTPAAAMEAVRHGHEVVIQAGAGTGAGFADADYVAAGARMADTAEEIFATADMIVKVKEPQAAERAMLRESLPQSIRCVSASLTRMLQYVVCCGTLRCLTLQLHVPR